MPEGVNIKPVEIGEYAICRVVISGLNAAYMNVQGGVNLTRVAEEYQAYTRSVSGVVPDAFISETVKASYNRILPAVQFKSVLPTNDLNRASLTFLNMAYFMVGKLCAHNNLGEAVVTIGDRETKLYVSQEP